MAERHGVLGVSVVAFAATMLARLVLSPVVPRIIAEFNVTKSAVGIALSGMWAAYAVLQFPSGVLGERFGERQVVVAALGLTALGSFLVGLAPSFPMFALVTLALGVGAGLYFSPATSLLTRLFEETGGALSIHSAGASIGGLVAPAVAAAVAARYGWRAAAMVGAAVAGLVAVLYAIAVHKTQPTHPNLVLRDRIRPSVLRSLLGRPEIAFTTGVGVTTVFAWQAVASFLPTFLVEYRSFTETEAGLAFSGLFVLTTVALPVAGRLSDRYSRDGILGLTLLLAALGLVGLVVIPGRLGLLVGGGSLAIGLAWGGVVQSRFMDRFAPEEQGTGFGLVRTVYMLLGASGSAVTGTLAAVAGWPVAFGAVAALLLAAASSLTINRLLGLGL
ncbi:MAG: MFS transporter [Halobacteriaceae archaeon]